MKNLPARPNIKPSALDQDRDEDDPPPGGGATTPSTRKHRRPRTRNKRHKHLEIHHTTVIEPEPVPAGSRFRGYRDFDVQDLIISAFNTRRARARLKLANELPPNSLNSCYFSLAYGWAKVISIGECKDRRARARLKLAEYVIKRKNELPPNSLNSCYFSLA